MTKAYCTGYLTGKVSRLPIDPEKPRTFSTSNDLQYTIYSVVLYKDGSSLQLPSSHGKCLTQRVKPIDVTIT